MRSEYNQKYLSRVGVKQPFQPKLQLVKASAVIMALLLELSGAQLRLLVLAFYRIEPPSRCIVEILPDRTPSPLRPALLSRTPVAESSTEGVAAVLVEVDDGVESEDQVLAGAGGLEDVGQAGVEDVVEQGEGSGGRAEGEAGEAGGGQFQFKLVCVETEVSHFGFGLGLLGRGRMHAFTSFLSLVPQRDHFVHHLHHSLLVVGLVGAVLGLLLGSLEEDGFALIAVLQFSNKKILEADEYLGH
jgi:hypothetical protein